MIKTSGALNKLLRRNLAAAQQDVPGGNIRDQLPGRALPPGGPGGSGYPPAPHDTDWGDVTGTPTTLAGYGIIDALANPMTTQDDLIIGGAAGVAIRLGKGSDEQVLTIDPSTHHVSWATPAVTLAAQSAHLVFAGPASGAAASPAFRALVALDLPALSWSMLTTGVPTTLAGYGITDAYTKTASDARYPVLSGGKVSSAVLPAIAITDTFVVASQVAMLALTAETGDVAVRTDLNKSYILAGSNPTVLADWQELLTPTDAVLSVAGKTGAVTLAAADIATGQLALARGGSGADLSATGGANQIVRQNSAGGVLTVSALAAADIPALDTSKLTTGVLPLARGGTGVAALPAFHVHKNGTNQTGIVTATFTLLTWSTEVVDSNSNFASNKFTPTIAGTYLIVVTVAWATMADQSYMVPIIYKNGVLYAQGAGRASGASDQSSNVVAVVAMNGSTDYLEAYCYQSTGSNKDVYGGIASTFFSGAWIGP